MSAMGLAHLSVAAAGRLDEEQMKAGGGTFIPDRLFILTPAGERERGAVDGGVAGDGERADMELDER